MSAAKLEIVQVGNPVLRQRARVLNEQEIRSRDTRELIESMRACMREAPGVGLAAPQVGLAIQLAVIEDRADYHKEVAEEQLRERERCPVKFHVIINPVIEEAGEETVEFFEGCLSLSGYTALVARSHSVRVRCLDERARPRIIDASGWYARILQHEIDHLHGALYIDRMRARSFTSMENFTSFWKGKPLSDVRQAFES